MSVSASTNIAGRSPSLGVVPRGQATHSWAPLAALYISSGHSLHSVALSLAEREPGLHWTACKLVKRAKVPRARTVTFGTLLPFVARLATAPAPRLWASRALRARWSFRRIISVCSATHTLVNLQDSMGLPAVLALSCTTEIYRLPTRTSDTPTSAADNHITQEISSTHIAHCWKLSTRTVHCRDSTAEQLCAVSSEAKARPQS